jgi:D-glycero-D-manno-heptose 1,7-bisphosphate phosphatase
MLNSSKRALFLDRDGVINVETGYVYSREEFEFLPGIFELCQAAQAQGYLLVVVTNQAGIGRGYYTETDFLELTEWMIERFAERNIEIARVYFCPDHPVHGVGKYKRDSPDRKPNPGMLLQAQLELQLALDESVLIGDKVSDIAAAKAAGVGTSILLKSPMNESSVLPADCHVVESLDEIRQRFFSVGAANGAVRGAEVIRVGK